MTLRLDGYDEPRRPTWTGTRLPTLYRGPLTCPRCGYGHMLTFPPYTEDALFYHGGYGESVRRTVGVCTACGRTSELRRETVRPPR